ncbi:MAG: response regulator, partial [Oscillospiraceae bacterium]
MRILVVEDEIELQHSIAEGLRLDAYAVDSCGDGLEAQALIAVEIYDLIILDLNLPGLDGFSLLTELRRENGDVKVLILSARDSLEDKIQGLDLGANDYLTKPFHFAELEARV